MFQKATYLAAAIAILATSVFAAVPPSSHVVVVMEENHSYSSVIGCSCMPYLNSLANQYGLATQYYANTHPSIGNYFMLTTGQIITNNDSYNTTVTADNLVRHLMTAGKTWKSYAESLPYAGYTGWDTNGYVKHHNPFAYFSDVVNSSNQKQNLVPFPQFATDLNNGQLPDFSFVIPNINNDGHNGTLQQADSWLQTHIAPLLANPTFQQDGLLIIVFDESYDSDTANGGGHTAMVVVGPKVAPGMKSTTKYQEQNVLRTVLDSLAVNTYPGAAASAQDMNDMFGSSSSSGSGTGSVVLSSPASGASVSSPIPVTASATANSGYHITGMYVYLDNVAVYHNSSSSLSTSVNASTGSHTVMVKAWDNSGRIYQKSATVTVGSNSTSSTTGSVVLSSPTSGATVGSPLQVTASATANSGYHITGMYVYLDNVAVYHNSSSSLSTSVSASTGSHTVLVKAWANTGRIYQKSASVTVGSTTASSGGVTITAPTQGASSGSPVLVQASATGGSYPITGMWVYVDNVGKYSTYSSSLSTYLSMASGGHTVRVKGWNSQGTIFQNSVSISVN